MAEADSPDQGEFRYMHHEVIMADEIVPQQPLFIPTHNSISNIKPPPKFESFLSNYRHFLDVSEDYSECQSQQVSQTSLIMQSETQRAVDAISETGSYPMHQELNLETPDSSPYSGVAVRPEPVYPDQYDYGRILQQLAAASTDFGPPLMTSSPAYFTPGGCRDFVLSDRSSFSVPRSSTLNSGGEDTTTSSSSCHSSLPAAPPNTPASDLSSRSIVRPRELQYLNILSPTIRLVQHQFEQGTDSIGPTPLKEWTFSTPNTVSTSISTPAGCDLAATRRSGSRRVTKAFHNEKERDRRSRVKNACDSLKTLIPGLYDKTNRASLLELTVHYVEFINNVVKQKSNGVTVDTVDGNNGEGEGGGNNGEVAEMAGGAYGALADEGDENAEPIQDIKEPPESYLN